MDKKGKIFAYLAGACAAILVIYYMVGIIQAEENATFLRIEYIIELCLHWGISFLLSQFSCAEEQTRDCRPLVFTGGSAHNLLRS